MQPNLQATVQGSARSASTGTAQYHMLLAISLIPTVIGAAVGINMDFSFLRSTRSSVWYSSSVCSWLMFAIERTKKAAWVSD